MRNTLTGRGIYHGLVKAPAVTQHALNDPAMLQLRPSKIEQEANPEPGGATLIQALSGMYLIQRLHGLQLEDDLLLDHEIGDEIADGLSFVAYRHRLFLRKMKTGRSHLDG